MNTIIIILAGLLLCWLSEKAHFSILRTIVFWLGIVLVVAGLLVFLTPLIVLLSAQVRQLIACLDTVCVL